MCANTRVETDALDDGLAVETFHLGIGVEFIEIAYTQGKICVGEEFYGFSLFHAHEKAGDVLGFRFQVTGFRFT